MPDNGFTAEEMRVLLPLFLDSGREYVVQLREGLLRLRNLPSDEQTLRVMHRAVHSLKGAALQLGFAEIGHLASCIEDALEGIQEGDRAAAGVVDAVDEGARALTEQLDAAESEIAPRGASPDLLDRLTAIAVPKSKLEEPS